MAENAPTLVIVPLEIARAKDTGRQVTKVSVIRYPIAFARYGSTIGHQVALLLSFEEANPIPAPAMAPITAPIPGTIVPAAPPRTAPEIVRFLLAQA